MGDQGLITTEWLEDEVRSFRENSELAALADA
jgi:hypothetical protein